MQDPSTDFRATDAARAAASGPLHNVSADEIAKFQALARDVWDPKGSFRPLHHMTSVRMEFIASRLCQHFGRDRNAPRPLAGLRLLDVGCGGGLASEPLARLGAQVTGIDLAPDMIEAAKLHATALGLEIDYHCQALEETPGRFDAIISLEVLEHLPDVPAFLTSLHQHLEPQGTLIVSTLNRSPQAYAFAIVAAEQILRLLPKGTHDIKAFIKPEELSAMADEAGLQHFETAGMVFDPLRADWRLAAGRTEVNYISQFLPADGPGPMTPPPGWDLG